MKNDREICREMLERFCAKGQLATTDREEVYAAYLLQRMGCVVAVITINSTKDEYSAEIKEVTIHGKKKFLDRASSELTKESATWTDMQKLAIQSQLDNDKTRDSVLLHLASGGIGLAFALMSFQTSIDKVQYFVWVIAVGAWIFSLLSLLVSFTTSRIMYDNHPSLCSSKKATDTHAIAAFLNCWANRFAMFLFFIGLIMFTAYVVIKAEGVIK